MFETGQPDAWHEQVIATIRERAAKNQTSLACNPNATATDAPIYNWPEVSNRLGRATAVSAVEDAPLCNPRHTGLGRYIIIAIRRRIVILLRFLTNRQSEFNNHLVQSVHETGTAVQRLERRLAAQDQEIWHLRERISHLERHSTAAEPLSRHASETIRKAS
jgi:hypothetical protein